jgi:creatinine amidohydrolase
MRTVVTAFGAMTLAALIGGQIQRSPAGVALADLTWQDAEPLLNDSAVVVIPLGAGALEYGPHMKLGAGETLARYLASRVQAAASVVIAPPLTYHFFPAYAEYPGSTSLAQNTARDETVDAVRSLAQYGPKRFYVLNTGGATIRPLADAAKMLADNGILLGWTDMRYQLANARIARQQRAVDGAPHADELETSMMLAIDPASVDMKKAVADYARGTGLLTRKSDGTGIVSRSGVLGDPTVATSDKGHVLIDTLVAGVLKDIDDLRAAPLPVAKAAPAPAAPRPAAPMPPVDRRLRSGCTEGEQRAIIDIGSRFSSLWRQMDAAGISMLFSDQADFRHPDGTVERTRPIILSNRVHLFTQKEYIGSTHPMTVTDVRCLGSGYAIADGKWELRFSGSSSYYRGLFTLVLSGEGSAWQIEAWRYTVDPPAGAPPPTTLKQPGFIGRGGG